MTVCVTSMKLLNFLNFRALLVGCVVFSLTACGIPVGSGIPRDNTPVGVRIAAGPLSGGAGQSASGTAEIYNNNGSFTARLNSIVVASEAGLQVRVYTTQANPPVMTATLRSSQGSQNYTIG